MMALEWVIGIAVAAVGLGYLVAYLQFRSSLAAKQEAAQLQQQLETANAEMEDYKQNVLGQFAQTAEKFRALDASYHDLHRQLATSAATLIGDRAANPLLSAPEPTSDEERAQAADQAIEVDGEALGSVSMTDHPDEQPESAASEVIDDVSDTTSEVVSDPAPADEGVVVTDAAPTTPADPLDATTEATPETLNTETSAGVTVDDVSLESNASSDAQADDQPQDDDQPIAADVEPPLDSQTADDVAPKPVPTLTEVQADRDEGEAQAEAARGRAVP